jgi:hypothetical protein
VAGQIKTGAESAKNRAGKQKDKAGMLEEEVEASRKRLEELEKKAMEDEQIIRQVRCHLIRINVDTNTK